MVDTPKNFSELYDKTLKYAKVEEVFKARYPGSVPNTPTGGQRIERERRLPPRAAPHQARDYMTDRRGPPQKPRVEAY